MSNEFNRRKFIGVGAVAAAGLMVGCSSKGGKQEVWTLSSFWIKLQMEKNLKLD